MFSNKLIIKKIKERLQSGDNKFAIFPYGENGLLVENILEKYFDIKPVYIVDNEICKFNRKVISLSEFKKIYQKDLCVFLTIENKEIHKELYSELKKFVLENRIISLFDDTYVMTKVDNQFELKSFLPLNEEQKQREKWTLGKKIRIRILYDEIALWNSIVSICKAFQEDEVFEFKVIIAENRYRDRMIKSVEGKNCSYILEETYNVMEDKPNVLILVDPFKKYKILAEEYRKNTDMIVVASVTLVSYTSSVKECEQIYKECVGQCHPDYYLFDSLLYQQLRNSNILKGKIVEMGNAKFDGIYKACELFSYSIPHEWEKLHGKKLILWATTHGIYGGKIKYTLTFDLYAKKIFTYAQSNKNLGLIFRPHPSFIDELLKNGYWSLEDLKFLKKYICETDNIVWDEFDSYDLSYAVADAILTDGYCGMICSALPTMKPIGVTYRDQSILPMHPELEDCYYEIYSEDDLDYFFDEVVGKGVDKKYEVRKDAVSKYIKHFDGKNGERIRDFVKKEFLEKYTLQ